MHSITSKSGLPSFYISFFPFLGWYCAMHLGRYCTYLRCSPAEWGKSCTIWFSSCCFHLALERDGEILEWAVARPALGQASRTCNSANPAWPMLAIISEFGSEHPTHGPTWLTRPDAAILLLGLEDTSSHRTVRPLRGITDFFMLDVMKWYRSPKSFPVIPTHSAAAQNLLPNPPKPASPAQKVCSEN